MGVYLYPPRTLGQVFAGAGVTQTLTLELLDAPAPAGGVTVVSQDVLRNRQPISNSVVVPVDARTAEIEGCAGRPLAGRQPPGVALRLPGLEHRLQLVRERAGHQQAAQIAGDDDAVVRIAQVVHCNPYRKSQSQRDSIPIDFSVCDNNS